MKLNNIEWNKDSYKEFINYLYSLEDKKYKDFHKKLILDENLIGIRTNILKNISKEISKTNYKEFIKLNKHNLYEEKIIHGLILGYLNDFNDVLDELDKFITYNTNWAINDTVCANLKIFKKNQIEGYKFILDYLKIDDPKKIRFALVLLLDHYINDNYIDKILNIVNNIQNDDYYVKMANAWLISICFIKYPDKTYKLLLKNNLDKFTFNKAISKICDSSRVEKEIKEELKKLRQ